MKKPEKIDSFEKADRAIQDFFNNIGFSDLNPSDIRTEVPTANTLEAGKAILFDNGSIRRIYFRALDGTIVSLSFS